MKKILVALVVLALAGGGAFAQGWTFNGQVDGGIGVFSTENRDDAFMTHLGSREGGNGIRTQLETRFVNNDGNAGLFLRIRQDHRGAAETTFNVAHGWVSLMDNLLTVYGGLVDHGYFNMLDRMTGEDMGEGLGLSFILRPTMLLENLTLGFGSFAARTGAGLYLTEAPQGKFTFGVAFDEPDTFQVRFGVRNTNEANDLGFTNWGVPAYDRPAAQGSLAYLSFAFLALEDIHLAATAAFQNLEEFGDYGAMRFYVTAGHTGLVENLDARLGAAIGLSQRDAHDDMHLWIWASAAYQLSDMVVPRLDLHYVMGGTAGTAGALHHNQFRNNATFDSENSFVQIRPSVQLRAAPNAFLEIGGIFNIDLGDNNTFNIGGTGLGAVTAGGNNNNGTNVGAYALVRVNF